jgi:hypothetical protein
MRTYLKPEPVFEAKRLTACGFRAISNRYCKIARVGEPVPKDTDMDNYRRTMVNKNRVVTVPKEIYSLIPSSTNDNTGFIALDTCDKCRKQWPRSHMLAVERDFSGTMDIICLECRPTVEFS